MIHNNNLCNCVIDNNNNYHLSFKCSRNNYGKWCIIRLKMSVRTRDNSKNGDNESALCREH